MHDDDDKPGSLRPSACRAPFARSKLRGRQEPATGWRTFPAREVWEPEGQRKGKHVATQVREAFTALRTVSIGGRQYKLPTIVALVHQATAQAFKGDKGAMALNFSLAARLGVLDEPQTDESEPPDEQERQIMEDLLKRMSRAYGRTDD